MNSSSSGRNCSTFVFAPRHDFLSALTDWATTTGFTLQESTTARRVYRKKGQEFDSWPVWVEVRLVGTNVHVSTWIEVSLLKRALHLFLLPGQIPVAPSTSFSKQIGFEARKDLNLLLKNLGTSQLENVKGHALPEWSTLALGALLLGMASLLYLKWVQSEGFQPNLFFEPDHLRGALALSVFLPVPLLLVLLRFGLLKWFKRWQHKVASVLLTVPVFFLLVLTCYWLSGIDRAIYTNQLEYHCIHNYDSEKCKKAKETISDLVSSDRNFLSRTRDIHRRVSIHASPESRKLIQLIDHIAKKTTIKTRKSAAHTPVSD